VPGSVEGGDAGSVGAGRVGAIEQGGDGAYVWIRQATALNRPLKPVGPGVEILMQCTIHGEEV